VDVRLNIAGYAHGGDAAGDLLLEFENLIGSDHDDFLFGDAGNNVIEGGSGNDFLQGLAGDDTIHGGAGIDRALLDGPRSDYSVTDFGGGKRIVNLTTFEDDRIFDVEHLTFLDTTLSF
ncbi:hypothetical protein LR948_14560, partial [Roseivivax sp. GX 12232]|uniref:calcium-binding protein n=1 Tax=Roseivivax sp. GX 12232 TaxID=2900547 RepID=UPI001E3010CA